MMRRDQFILFAVGECAILLMSYCPIRAATRGDQMLAAYFRSETQTIADACLADIKTWSDWTSRRETYRQQLREMLGLDPLPERTPLNAVVTGTLERDDFKIEKLYFQSRPHLYVTGNLYLPKHLSGRAPAILYVCGHTPAKEGDVSFGNKTKYQHHGAWFAQNGYVCLVIDTLQMGEIEGIHHGTYRENMWWWNSRGYTPAGVEAWNSIRAIDYLVSRPEVDPERIGMTGRSGGGAYTWYTAALDDRVKVAVPVAGITDLKNHVVDGCVEGHCDCMYMVNTYRWDFPQVAALVSPRPLLIANTDRDGLFPLDGVMDVYQKVRRLYELAGKGDDIALQLAPGPHEDLQVLQLGAMKWFNHYLKHDDSVVDTVAKDYFKPAELKVFNKLPADQINTKIQESFVPEAAKPRVPNSKEEWQAQRDAWMRDLREKVFRGWPTDSKSITPPHLHLVFDEKAGDLRFCAYDFDSQPNVTLRLFLMLPASATDVTLESVELRIFDTTYWHDWLSKMPTEFAELPLGVALPDSRKRSHPPSAKSLFGSTNTGLAFVAPRGIGPTQWTDDGTKQTHIRRRFMLLGQTLDGMRVWDVRRTIQALRAIDGLQKASISLVGAPKDTGVLTYTALFEPKVDSLTLYKPSKTHRDGPDLLNVRRFLDMPQTIAMVAERSNIAMIQDKEAGWDYPSSVARKLGWEDHIKTSRPPIESKHSKRD